MSAPPRPVDGNGRRGRAAERADRAALARTDDPTAEAAAAGPAASRRADAATRPRASARRAGRRRRLAWLRRPASRRAGARIAGGRRAAPSGPWPSGPWVVPLLLLLPLLLLPGPARAQGRSQGCPDRSLAAQVLGAALGFVAPRALDPVTVPELALWGLRGLASLDPTLSAALDEGQLRVSRGASVLLGRPAPPPGDVAAWGDVAAELAAAACAASPGWQAADGTDPTVTLLRAMFAEMLAHLDPYSRYVPPHRAQAERDRLAGAVDPGVQLGLGATGIVLSAVQPGSPAAVAGLRAGDRLLAVDGTPTEGEAIAAVAARLSGPEGSAVSVQVAGRGAGGRARTVQLVRAQLPPQSVLWRRMGDVLVVQLSLFAADTAERLSDALTDGLDEGPGGRRTTRGVVLDLRGNRGGLLRQAVTAVALLVDGGLVATTTGRDPQAARTWEVRGGDLAEDRPVVVLVDGRTASAAEVVAAALADRRRAVVVGSATLGKGLVQAITPLPDGGELFVTWSRILAPLGWPLQGLGVLPQLCTSGGEEETARAERALLGGTQPLQAALVASRQARAPLTPGRVLALRSACPAAMGSDADLDAARFLLTHPEAYRAALLDVPPS